MGYRKMLTKAGSHSHQLLIDKVILDLLGWDLSTMLDITTDGVSLIIRDANKDASGGKRGLRSRATIKRKTKELEQEVEQEEEWRGRTHTRTEEPIF